MLIAPPRLNVGAWLALAVTGPTLMLAAAAGAGAAEDGPTRWAGLWAAVVLSPAVALCLRSLETRRARVAAGPERMLVAAFGMSVAQASGVLLAVLMGAALTGQAIACGLTVAAFPLAVAVPLDVLRRLFPNLPLQPTGLAQTLYKPDAGGRQGPVEWAEHVRLEEMAGEVEARADVAGAEPRLGREQEAGQGEQPVLVGLAGVAADRAAGAGADVDEVVHGAGGGAAGEVEPEAQVLEQAGLEAHEDRGPDLRVQEGAAEGLEGEEGARMWLPLRKRAGRHGGGGGHPRQRQWIVEERCRPLTLGLKDRRAQLFGDAGAVADEAAHAGLQVRPHALGGAAGDVGGVAAVAGGEQVHDRPALAVGAGREHEGVVGEFHRIKLWVPAEEIQPPISDAAVAFDAALAELKGLLADYKSKVVVEAAAEAA
jgi:hypothetical protein